MRDPSPTSGARDTLSHMTAANPNRETDVILKMLKDLLNQGIKPAIEAQSQALEKIITQKSITMLSTIMIN